MRMYIDFTIGVLLIIQVALAQADYYSDRSYAKNNIPLDPKFVRLYIGKERTNKCSGNTIKKCIKWLGQPDKVGTISSKATRYIFNGTKQLYWGTGSGNKAIGLERREMTVVNGRVEAEYSTVQIIERSHPWKSNKPSYAFGSRAYTCERYGETGTSLCNGIVPIEPIPPAQESPAALSGYSDKELEIYYTQLTALDVCSDLSQENQDIRTTVLEDWSRSKTGLVDALKNTKKYPINVEHIKAYLGAANSKSSQDAITFYCEGVLAPFKAEVKKPDKIFSFSMSKEIAGTIVDADTSEPIEGVVVTASWMLTGWLDAHRSIGAFHIAEAVTDQKGRYTLTGWGLKAPLLGYLDREEPKVRFFKSGYAPLVVWNNWPYHPGLEGDHDHMIKVPVKHHDSSTGVRLYEPEEHQVKFGKKHHTFMLKQFKGTDQEYAKVVSEDHNIKERYISSLNRLRSNEDCNWKKIPLTLMALDKLGAKFERSRVKKYGMPRISSIGSREGPCGSGGKYFKQYKIKSGLSIAPDVAEVIPDTGQNAKYFKFTGEDADYAINPQSYYASNGTVLDNNTGLLWQQDADSERREWYESVSYCEGLVLGGVDDWRLPTRTELLRIVTFGSDNPTINELSFYQTDILRGWYWTSTEGVNDPSKVWTVNFNYGGSGLSRKSPKMALSRCVSGRLPLERKFIANNDGTVTDKHTKLMWQQAEAVRRMGLESAIDYCETLTFANHDDWRLPSINELESLIVYTKINPAADIEAFPELSPKLSPISYYWSSTISGSKLPAKHAIAIAFVDGGLHGIHSLDFPLRTRCVRGGIRSE